MGKETLPPSSNRAHDGSSEIESWTPDSKAFIVAIDGPAASGKSSVSRLLSARLGWQWVSTGAFYRGLALVAQKEGYDFNSLDPKALFLLANNSIWHVELTAEKTRVWYRGSDLTEEIAKEEVGSLASKISSQPLVRQALLDSQRACANGRQGLVAEGRDCGTVVFPTAQLKVFLTAKAEDRAKRRAQEEGLSLKSTIAAQSVRDAQDASRKSAPMAAAPDALIIDSSLFPLEEVVDRVEALARERLAKHVQ